MKVAECKLCGEEYSIKRFELGYHLCLECGDSRAGRIASHRARCSAPAFNKGAYAPMMTREDALWAGR